MSWLLESPSKRVRYSDVETQDVEMQDVEMPEAQEMQEEVKMQSFDVSSDENCNYWTYDSKEFTGYVGLKKEGLTCYMNSFLQSLYHIPAFRKAVYNISTHDDKLPSSTPLALQSLFCKLQCDNSSVGTKDFPKSFGWDIYDSFMQNNAFNLNMLLFEKLKEKMKRTLEDTANDQDTAIDHLFRGHYNGIDRRKPFYALQLDVEGCKDVYASFDKYGEKERVKGDNENVSKQHVLQDATNDVYFDLPPILLLHLNRFKIESGGETMLKINDSYEFPLELNLDKYLSPDDKRGLYVLHSVLVHSGGVHGGHYYAYIRPTLSDEWYKFDDERVTQEQSKTAIKDQYGVREGSSQTHEERNGLFKYTNYSNAHMLVYIRKSETEKIIYDMDEKDVADVKTRLLEKDGEADENKEKKFKAEGGLYIKVFRDEDLHKQIGKDQCFDLVGHNKDKIFTCCKHKPELLMDLKKTILDIFKVPSQSQRLWMCEETPNHTYHPSRLLTVPDETQLGKLIDVSKKNHTLYLFLKEDTTLDLGHHSPLARSREHILVFVKFYESEKTEPQNLGSYIVKRSDIVIEFIRDLIMKAKLSINDEIELYQEMPFKPCLKCEHLGKEDTFAEIQDGDIIWFQKKADPYPDVLSYLEYKENVQFVNFRSLTDGHAFKLELSKQDIYDNVVQKVAINLREDSSLIELTSYNHYLDGPNSHPIKPQAGRCLMDMLVHYNEVSNILYYKVLAEPLPQKDSKKDLKVSYYNPPRKEARALDIKLDKNSTVADLLDVIRGMVTRVPRGAKFRLLDVYHHRIYKIFEPNQKIGGINDDGLRAEIIQDEEENITPPDRLVHVYYFTLVEGKIQYYGDPFLLKISESDKLKVVKDRIRKKLRLSQAELSTWRFSVVSLRQLELPQYIEHDEEIVLTYFESTGIDAYGGWAQHLGIQLQADAPANQ